MPAASRVSPLREDWRDSPVPVAALGVWRRALPLVDLPRESRFCSPVDSQAADLPVVLRLWESREVSQALPAGAELAAAELPPLLRDCPARAARLERAVARFRPTVSTVRRDRPTARSAVVAAQLRALSCSAATGDSRAAVEFSRRARLAELAVAQPASVLAVRRSQHSAPVAIPRRRSSLDLARSE